MSKTPLLDAALASGMIWLVDRYDYVGRAADGVIVTVGCNFDAKSRASLERWLADYPTPDLW